MDSSSQEAARTAALHLRQQTALILGPISADRPEYAAYVVGFCEGVRGILHHVGVTDSEGDRVAVLRNAIANGLSNTAFKGGKSVEDLLEAALRFAEEHLPSPLAADAPDSAGRAFMQGFEDGEAAPQHGSGLVVGFAEMGNYEVDEDL